MTQEELKLQLIEWTNRASLEYKRRNLAEANWHARQAEEVLSAALRRGEWWTALPNPKTTENRLRKAIKQAKDANVPLDDFSLDKDEKYYIDATPTQRHLKGLLTLRDCEEILTRFKAFHANFANIMNAVKRRHTPEED